MYKFKLKFRPACIERLASVYNYEDDDFIIKEIVPRVKKAGYMNRKDFLELCRWKTPRSRPHCEKNSRALIKKITSISLNTKDEKEKIEILTTLSGVGWPTASTILHFTSGFRYPILDYRALWSLGYEKPPVYNFEFYEAYTDFCRKIAKKHNVSLRRLDKALWQYSAEEQR